VNRGAIAVGLSGITFGTYGLLSKAALASGMKAPTILFWRFLFAAIVLWIACRLLRRPPIPRGKLPQLILLGLAYLGMSTAYLTTIARAGASYAVLLLYAYPAFVAVIEHFMGNRLTRMRTLAVATAIAGIVLLIHGAKGSIDPLSLLIGISSALIYAVYLVGSSRVMTNVSSFSATTGVLTSAAIAFAVLAFFTTGYRVPSAGAGWAVVALAILATAIPILLLNYGIPRTGAPRAAVLGTLEPLTGVVLVVAFAGEHLDAVQLVGGAFLLACSMLRDTAETAPLEA